jgi:hypothetical protein
MEGEIMQLDDAEMLKAIQHHSSDECFRTPNWRL